VRRPERKKLRKLLLKPFPLGQSIAPGSTRPMIFPRLSATLATSQDRLGVPPARFAAT